MNNVSGNNITNQTAEGLNDQKKENLKRPRKGQMFIKNKNEIQKYPEGIQCL